MKYEHENLTVDDEGKELIRQIINFSHHIDNEPSFNLSAIINNKKVIIDINISFDELKEGD